MDYPTMGLCIAGIAAIAPFIYKMTPAREPKSILSETDLERLDERIKLYERVGRLESQVGAQSNLLQELKSDFKETSVTLFDKIDGLTTVILDRKERPHA